MSTRLMWKMCYHRPLFHCRRFCKTSVVITGCGHNVDPFMQKFALGSFSAQRGEGNHVNCLTYLSKRSYGLTSSSPKSGVASAPLQHISPLMPNQKDTGVSGSEKTSQEERNKEPEGLGQTKSVKEVKEFARAKASNPDVVIETVEVDVIDDKSLSVWQRLKNMYRHYWYVAIPVHCVTSGLWYGIFYVCAKNGVDVVPLLELLHTPEWVLDPVKKTGAGTLAVMFAMYKVATPARYTVTVACTTWAISYLKKKGKIKPVKEIRKIVRKKASEKRKDVIEKMKRK